MISIESLFTHPLALILALVVCIFIVLIVRQGQKMPYRAQKSLLTPAELKFYKILQQAVPAQTSIMMKVRMGDLITCDDRDWHKGWGPKISAKHIDFVVIDAHSTAIIAAIELDDSTHRTQADRIARDKFVNQAFEVAGLPLLRVNVAHCYDREALQAMIKTVI